MKNISDIGSDWVIDASTVDTAFRTNEELHLACDNADIKSISFWKGVEDELGGKIIFKIKPPLDGKRIVDVLCYTTLSAGEVAMNGILLYAKWELYHK